MSDELQERPVQASSCPRSAEPHMCEVLPIRVAQLSCGVKVFTRGQSCWRGAPALLTLATLSSFYTRRGQMDTVGLKAPGKQIEAITINHVVSINYLMWPKTLGIQRHYLAGYCKGLALISQKRIKGQFVFGGWAHPKPVEVNFYCMWGMGFFFPRA